MAIDEILITVSPGETRAAFLERGVLGRFELARGGAGPRAGDVILGRVGGVVGGIDAAFVDIGHDRAGFLGLAEARTGDAGGGRIGDFVGEGDAVLVQVMREPTAGKGAKLTRRPTLPGRFLVMMPEGTGVHVSRRIGDNEARKRLERLLAPVADAGGGWIARSAAVGTDDSLVLDDVESLRAVWAAIADQARSAPAPDVLRRSPDAVVSAVIDEAGPALKRIAIDDPGLAAELRTAAPDVADKVVVDSGRGALFAARDVDAQLDAALAPAVALAGGGSVTFSETAALVAIDVDTGGTSAGGREETAMAVNVEATRTIAQQVRLRDLAGHLIIDFVPMKRRDNGACLLDALRDAFAADARQTQVAGFTRLGVVEMTRRRRGPPLSERMMTACPACAGTGRVASAETSACSAPAHDLAVRAPEAVVQALGESLAPALAEVEARTGRRVRVVSDPEQGAGAFCVGPMDPGADSGNG